MDVPTSEMMPQGAVVVAIPVLIVSIISLGMSVIWFLMQHYHSERWSYVGLMALTVCLSTTASIVQQFWYIWKWRHDRISEYHQAKIGVYHPSLAVGPLATGPSQALFWVQMYCYNVIALLVLFWAVALVRDVYNCRSVGSTRFNRILVPATKVCCILLPVILVTVPFAPIFDQYAVASIVVTCAPMILCWSIGGACIVSILIKYVRGLVNFTRIEDSRSNDISLQSMDGNISHIRSTDKWLLLRFGCTFVALCTFEIMIINTALTRSAACTELAARDGPDFSVSSTVGSVLMFLPGVLAGIFGFLVFATSSHFRKVYSNSLHNCCSCRRRKRRMTDDTDGNEDALSTAAYGIGGAPTYHCRVTSTVGDAQLAGGKRDSVIDTLEAQNSPVRAPGPWRALGLDSKHVIWKV